MKFHVLTIKNKNTRSLNISKNNGCIFQCNNYKQSYYPTLSGQKDADRFLRPVCRFKPDSVGRPVSVCILHYFISSAGIYSRIISQTSNIAINKNPSSSMKPCEGNEKISGSNS